VIDGRYQTQDPGANQFLQAYALADRRRQMIVNLACDQMHQRQIFQHETFALFG